MATKIWVGTDTGNEGDLNTAANWSPSGVPIAADDVYFVASSQAVTGSLTALSAVALTSLTIDQSYTGAIGTEDSFMECDPGTLRIGGNVGTGSPTGSGRINLDLGNNAQEVFIENSASIGTDTNRAPIRLQLNNASNNVYITGGKVAIEDDPDMSGQVATINVSQGKPDATSTNVKLGDGLTVATLAIDAGTVSSFQTTTLTTLNMYGGTLTINGTGAITTANMRGGDATLSSSGTITTINVDGGNVNFGGSREPRTITNFNYDSGNVTAPDGVVTLTNGINPDADRPFTITINK